jgi:hypothetical protein
MAQRETPRLPSPAAATEYWVDAWQRGVLFLDVMRRRATQYDAHAAEIVPNVLDYNAELVVDGRRLERPVNYLLARIVPSEGIEIDPRKRPFVIIDPRAGHGPGIGGFKADSEIGVAMKPVTRPTSSASCPTRCPARPSRTSPALRRSSSRPSSPFTPRPTASPA